MRTVIDICRSSPRILVSSPYWISRKASGGVIHFMGAFDACRAPRNQTVYLPGGKTTTVLVGQEQGVDVHLALDVVRFARENKYDVAVIFSQDQDLSELAGEVRSIAHDYNRWINLACAYPVSPTTTNSRGISGMDSD